MEVGLAGGDGFGGRSFAWTAEAFGFGRRPKIAGDEPCVGMRHRRHRQDQQDKQEQSEALERGGAGGAAGSAETTDGRVRTNSWRTGRKITSTAPARKVSNRGGGPFPRKNRLAWDREAVLGKNYPLCPRVRCRVECSGFLPSNAMSCHSFRLLFRFRFGRLLLAATLLSLLSACRRVGAGPGGQRRGGAQPRRRRPRSSAASTRTPSPRYQKLIARLPELRVRHGDARFHLAYANFLTGQYRPRRRTICTSSSPRQRHSSPRRWNSPRLLLPQVLAQQAAARQANDPKRSPRVRGRHARSTMTFIAKFPKSTEPGIRAGTAGRWRQLPDRDRYDAAARDLRRRS